MYNTHTQGSGAFGVVHEATWRGRPVAVKLLAAPHASVPDATRALRTLRREVELRAACTSPRLVRVYAACFSPVDTRRSCVVMELVRGGCLAQRIHDRDHPPLSYVQVLQIAQDVAQGLAHLHPLVVHRDLKPQVRLWLDKCTRLLRTWKRKQHNYHRTSYWMPRAEQRLPTSALGVPRGQWMPTWHTRRCRRLARRCTWRQRRWTAAAVLEKSVRGCVVLGNPTGKPG